MINLTPITNVIGVLSIIIGGFMLLCLPVSFIMESGDHMTFVYSAMITIGFGLLLYFARFKPVNNVNKREGMLIVSLGWLTMVTFSSVPYMISGAIPSFTDAFFESMSGMTTTGASVLTDIESVSSGVLFWRSLTQWIGGMGIIVLTVAIFPLLGIGGIELFVAEAPGPTSDKIHPRIRETAKRLWLIYLGLTIALFVILTFGGMTVFDAINHAFTTMATGGFSTKNASIAHYTSPLIQYPIIIFMFLAGTNYTVLYWSLKFKWYKVWKIDEFKVYLGLVIVLVILITIPVHNISETGWEQSFRDSLFQIVSLLTTTGFVSADYTQWSESLTFIFFLIIFLGACAGSTAGGIKIIRHLVFFKNTYLEFKRIIHPRAIVPLKLNGQVVAPRILTHVIIFLLLYLMTFLVGSILVIMTGMDFLSAIGATATSISNVGPGIGTVGPVDNFAAVPATAKWILSFLMLLGRLELFTVLLLFTPFFWRSN
ncbi:MAG: TrkH family potassium uptake protein [Saprospiraceae bacterium]|nr:TrkH family potassium uptake protein [Saprospiraceae bacterium]